ncbi:septum formation inhibitor Maf [Georgenia yuyongxinii]|uniref:Nucleoside triphosphate pyrophosphatase n=1 Tax=Georgenia yuyongxinii TaxID=2589797 RepID=A0A5B8C0R8_9MICO|nr:nucleoside triphosphate pyrophosphatase [Georgenia yuyongxinii]QDC24028.1 septum formation inhibitor Maf [Georgenia yuyongxinii]
MTTLLLASASPARLSTLRAAGLDPLVAASSVDEAKLLATATTEADRAGSAPVPPADQVLLLARAKAHDVREHPTLAREADVVLGCDSMLELEGEVLGKPTDAADAVVRWQRMRGRTGVLHTGHCLLDRDGREASATSSTVVHFADLTDAEVDAYVATGEPLWVAGAFTVDGLGGPFVAGIEGDYHGVVGVSLPLLRVLLAELGVAITDLWRPAAD